MHGNMVCGTREALHLAWAIAPRAARRTQKGHGRDARGQGVGQLHGTDEATEQGGGTNGDEESRTGRSGGGRGGKGAGQGEDGRANQGPDTAPECPATCARPDTTGSAAGPREAVDCALAPCLRYQPPPRGV